MRHYKPLIGITPGFDYEKKMAYIKNGYFEGIQKVGGLPVLLSMLPEEELLLDAVERCDGVLVTGGPDVDARHYNEINLKFTEEISPYRDQLEIFAVKRAIELNKPLFGICRGIQVMNVAMGGTLYQDIHAQIKDRDVIKHSQEAPKWYPTHNVMIEQGSKVWECFRKSKIGVNSFHHQAIKDVAPGFVVTSRAEDGIIESIEYPAHRFAMGVQWHPELMWKEDPAFLELFKAFIESSRYSRIL